MIDGINKSPGRRFFERLLPALFMFALTVAGVVAQEMPKSALAFFSLVPKALTLRATIGTNTIIQAAGEETMGLGTYTGLLPWRPENGVLKIEAQGYAVLEKKPFLKPRETPLCVLKEVSPGTLDLLIVPNAKIRAPSFYDAINLSDQPTLQLQANKKEIELPQGQRIRLSTEKSLVYSLGQQIFDPIDPPENGNFLLVFFTDSDKTLRCMVTRDDLL
jgi:hypothetical protein